MICAPPIPKLDVPTAGAAPPPPTPPARPPNRPPKIDSSTALPAVFRAISARSRARPLSTSLKDSPRSMAPSKASRKPWPSTPTASLSVPASRPVRSNSVVKALPSSGTCATSSPSSPLCSPNSALVWPRSSTSEPPWVSKPPAAWASSRRNGLKSSAVPTSANARFASLAKALVSRPASRKPRLKSLKSASMRTKSVSSSDMCYTSFG